MEEIVVFAFFALFLLGFVFFMAIGLDGAICIKDNNTIREGEARMVVGCIGAIACFIGFWWFMFQLVSYSS